LGLAQTPRENAAGGGSLAGGGISASSKARRQGRIVVPAPWGSPGERSFRSVVDLRAAINHFLAETNHEPKPFIWTADPDKIIGP